ncbi:class I SAM-dependent methyltransferase [soil metagenome]
MISGYITGVIDVAVRYALQQVVVPAGRSLWLYGEPGLAGDEVYQPRADVAEALKAGGLAVYADPEKRGREYAAVYAHLPKQREEAEGLLALALDRSEGFVMAVARNDAGGSRLRKMLQAYGVTVETAGKAHCTVVWTAEAPKADRARVEENLAHLAPRKVALEGADWWTVPGLFSWNQVDPGSRLLLKHLPPDLKGVVADLGSGYGYLSTKLAQGWPDIRQIDAYEVDARAVACCARNGGERVKAIWQDIKSWDAAPQYDAVVMNPPFHTGKDEDVSLGRIFVEKAWASVKPGGHVFLVANRHLPYEKVVPELHGIHEAEGYKILTGCKA